jgi:predicted HicB family RNase H-like nuclease
MTAPQKNRNAAKPAEKRASEKLIVRVTAAEKARFALAAAAAGQKLSKWCRDQLHAASSRHTP